MKSIPTLLLALGGILGTSASAQVPGGPATNLRPALSSFLRLVSQDCFPSTHRIPHQRMNNSLQTLTAAQLKRALALRERIDQLESELASITGSTAAAPAGKAPKQRRMSAAGRAAISRAAKARWAKIHAAQKKVAK